MLSCELINALIHYHVTGRRAHYWEDPLTQNIAEELLAEGLIESHSDVERSYKTTPKGAAHICQLCNLPLPVVSWADADGNPIKLY